MLIFSSGCLAEAESSFFSFRSSKNERCIVTVLLPRRYITPPGQGFLPKETALHHQASHNFSHCGASSVVLRVQQDASRCLQDMSIALLVQKHAVRLVKEALGIAGVGPSDIACIAYTKVSPAPRKNPISSAMLCAAHLDKDCCLLHSSP